MSEDFPCGQGGLYIATCVYKVDKADGEFNGDKEAPYVEIRERRTTFQTEMCPVSSFLYIVDD